MAEKLEKEVENLCNIIAKIQRNNNQKVNYIDFLPSKISKYITKRDMYQVLDTTLKKFLGELKEAVPFETYNNVIVNMGFYSNQDGFDTAVGVIRFYYEYGFIVDNKELETISVIGSLIEQEGFDKNNDITELINTVMHTIFRFHYCFCVMK